MGLGPYRPASSSHWSLGLWLHPLQLTRKPEQWPGLELGWVWPGEQESSFPAGRGGGQPSASSEAEAAGLRLPMCAEQRYREPGPPQAPVEGLPWSPVHPPDLSDPLTPTRCSPSFRAAGRAKLPVISCHPHAGWRVSLFLEGHASRKSLTFRRFTDSGWNAWPSSGPKEKVEGGPGGEGLWVSSSRWASIPTRPACLPLLTRQHWVEQTSVCSRYAHWRCLWSRKLASLSGLGPSSYFYSLQF